MAYKTKNEKKAERAAKGVELLKELDIYKPYIRGFQKKGDTCWFENFGGFWTYQDEELLAKQKEIEEQYNCTVYAITHEYTALGEMYSFLVVPERKHDWNMCLEDMFKLHGNSKKTPPVMLGRKFYAFAYVWNKDDDFCSEFGTIGVQSYGGGLRRFA